MLAIVFLLALSAQAHNTPKSWAGSCAPAGSVGKWTVDTNLHTIGADFPFINITGTSACHQALTCFDLGGAAGSCFGAESHALNPSSTTLVNSSGCDGTIDCWRCRYLTGSMPRHTGSVS